MEKRFTPVGRYISFIENSIPIIKVKTKLAKNTKLVKVSELFFISGMANFPII